MDLSITDTTASPFDELVAGDYPRVTAEVVVLSGRNLLRGTVLGRVTTGAATPAAVAGNTGNGTIGAVTLGDGAKPGVYRLTAIEAGTDAGKFQVEDPDGVVVGVATVGVAFTGPINFTIADGATDFVAGDSFTITVAAGTAKVKAVDDTAADGSDRPFAVLAENTDATSEDKTAPVYLTGEFNEEKLIFGGDDTVDTHRDALRAINIFPKSVVPA